MQQLGDLLVSQYNEKYPGMPQPALLRVAPVLYRRLREIGKLNCAPRYEKSRPRKYSPDSLTFYFEHYAGVFKEDLYKVDDALRARLKRDGLLDKIPSRKQRFDDIEKFAYVDAR